MPFFFTYEDLEGFVLGLGQNGCLEYSIDRLDTNETAPLSDASFDDESLKTLETTNLASENNMTEDRDDEGQRESTERGRSMTRRGSPVGPPTNAAVLKSPVNFKTVHPAEKLGLKSVVRTKKCVPVKSWEVEKVESLESTGKKGRPWKRPFQGMKKKLVGCMGREKPRDVVVIDPVASYDASNEAYPHSLLRWGSMSTRGESTRYEF
eukprot:Nitzschia sp. Nitz4//scaffold88_size82704//35297//35920//NITZ4_005291-RA/size82704-processed-gene-0.100-mRNA-1//1//CDS//3329559491//5338//frame0